MMIWLYAGLLVVALIVYYGTIAKRNMWCFVALYWALLIAKCWMDLLKEGIA